MADALVHVASALPAGRALRDPKVRSLLYVGVLLPDLLHKSLLYLAGAPTWLCEPTHAPLALAVWCYAACLCFEAAWRRRAFFALFGGSCLHVLVDAFKSYDGTGVIPWAFPLSMDLVEAGLYTNDDSPWMAGAALAVVALDYLSRSVISRKGTMPPRK